jgi:type 1 fimbria pilin
MKKRLIFTFMVLLAAVTCCMGQTVRDGSNRTIGTIESNGTVRDGMNRTIGHFGSDGTVRDGMNRTIGSARGVKRTHAAVFFFFNMF